MKNTDDLFSKKEETTEEEVSHETEKKDLKDTSDVIACVFDYGTFLCLADKLGETFKKVYYYTPTSHEFFSMDDLIKGTGMENVERIEDIFEPEIFEEIDLFIFPDIGYDGLQKHIREMGKAVWGSMGADNLELLRTEFIKTLEKLNLPIIHSETIKGVTKLREHLKGVENKHIKVNKYRGNMETWHHIDIEHSGPELDRLDVQFGGMKEHVTFVVQDHIKTDVETGYDGWCIDGKFPSKCSQGYEKKNELYLASLMDYDKIPEQVREINEALAPILEKIQYRNFIATEIRVKDGIPYFIDPTMRMPGQSGEQLLETCTNLADIIWYGANGEMVEPNFKYKFAAAATMHYCAGGDWMVLKVPEKIKKWVKLYHYCQDGDVYHFPPKEDGEVGVVLGAANTIEGAIDKLKENLKAMKGEPIECKEEDFVELLEDIEKAEENGIKFSDAKLPKPESVI